MFEIDEAEIVAHEADDPNAFVDLFDFQSLPCAARSWDEARRAFSQALAIAPDDGPSLTFLARVDALVAAPPPIDWDGSWRLEQK